MNRRVNREAVTRLGIARKDELQVLITFDFWHSDLAACDGHRRDLLASMQLCQWVADPARGRSCPDGRLRGTDPAPFEPEFDPTGPYCSPELATLYSCPASPNWSTEPGHSARAFAWTSAVGRAPTGHWGPSA